MINKESTKAIKVAVVFRTTPSQTWTGPLARKYFILQQLLVLDVARGVFFCSDVCGASKQEQGRPWAV
jgi:hypothetical protein